MKLNFRFMFILLATLILASCSKEEILEDAQFDAQEDLAYLEQELLTVELWEESEDELQNGRLLETNVYLATPNCGTRSWDTSTIGVRKLTIDFGTTPCLGNDGLYRTGVIMITYSGPRGVIGSTRLTEFMAYRVMNIEFNGTKQIEFIGNHQYTRTVDVSKKVNTATSTWVAEQLVEKIAGYGTPQRNDDIFQVTGTGNGVRRNGVTYTSEITAPLLRKILPGCYQNFVDGAVLFTNDQGVETLLDYDPIGGAPCDKLAAITRNGQTHFITLW